MKRPKKIKEPNFSNNSYHYYRKSLQKVVKTVEKKALKMPLKRFDNTIALQNSLYALIDDLINVVKSTFGSFKLLPVLNKWTKSISTHHARKFDSKVKKYKDIEVSIKDSINTSVKDEVIKRIAYNVSLIKTVEEDLKAKLRNDLTKLILDGRGENVKDIVKNRIGQSHRRLKIIAHDQTLKLSKAITVEKSKALGAKEFIYRTSLDEKVRKSHRDANGKTYSLEKSRGLDLQLDVNCRCTKEILFNF